MAANRVVRVTLVLSLLLLVAPMALAQQTGSVSGTVTATDGAVLPGVTVEARSNVLPQPRVTVTLENGDYRFPSLVPGTYTITFSLAGLNTVTRNVNVQLDQNQDVDAQLGLAGVAEEITVTAEATLVDRQSAEVQTGVSNAEIRALPISQEYRDLQRLIPGVQITQDTVRGPSGGGSGQDNVYLFDGVNVTLPLFGVLAADPATHDVAQYSVLKGGARAVDFERAGGFSVDSVSRSGTNEFAGQFSYQTRRPQLVADQKNVATVTRYDQTRHWTTINFGGPLLRDQLFFYASYYRPDYRRDNQSNNYGELPSYRLERDEIFGKLTWTPTSAWLINGSYRDSSRDETGDTFGGSTAGTTGFGFQTELKIGTLEGSWVPNGKMYSTFKFTDFQSPGGGVPATLATPLSLAPGTRLDLNNLQMAGQFTVPTVIGTNPTQAPFAQALIDRYGYVGANGQRVGGGIIGTSRFAIDDDDFYRRSGEVGFNYTLGSNITHDLHVGYQRYVDQEDRLQVGNGWGLLSAPGGTVNCPAAACGTITPAFFQAQVFIRTNPNIELIHSEFHSQNFEINDTIRMGNWTFNAGVLASEDTLYGQGLREADNLAGYVSAPGQKYKMHRIPFSQMIQPRVSGTWAYNGSDTVYASYARYNPAANSDARAASWDRNLFSEINAYFDVNGVLIGNQAIPASSGKLFVDGIKPRYTDEYMIGTAQQFTPTLSSRAYARYRYSTNFWEDTNNNARTAFGANVPGVTQALYIPDLPARVAAIGSGSSYVIAELDNAFTKFYEATVESDWRATGNTMLRGSYTWSHYYGTFDQDNSTFNSANDTSTFIGSSNIADGAGRQIWNFKYGDLRGDRRHVLKFYGTQVLPWRATMGIFGIFQSGQPYQLESFLPYTGLTANTSDTNRYAEPAGRRKSPSHHQVDLSYTQNVPIPWGGLNLQLVLDVFNVYDKQTGYNYETRVGSLGVKAREANGQCLGFEPGDVAPALSCLQRAPFAKSFYDPRTIQLAARINF
ncbi:MAG TPA: TonB-dependent receptor [Thermoanaerobaculia bacterium]|nr:TonB-dependent receptor [Thermoanaerobaculia bacterium]